MTKISQIISLAYVALLLLGCATSIPGQSTSLSDVFELKRYSGGVGIWKWKRDDIYVHEKNSAHKYIGTTEADGFAPYFIKSIGAGGLDHRTLAISKDGHSIVFSHWALYAPSKSTLENGLHRYRYGDKVEKIISAKSMSTASWTSWPKPLPANILPFSYRPVTYSPEDMTWAISADDYHLFPLALLNAQPIHQCAFDGRAHECEILLKQGANIDAKTYWGFTPIDLAIIRDQEDTAIYLLKHGASLDVGMYPALHRAVMLGRMRVVKAILAQGVDVNKQDEHGYTPLHLAIYAGRRLTGGIRSFFDGTVTPRSIIDKNITTALVWLLLEHGANPHIKNKSGKLPIEEASEHTPQETIEILLQYGKGK